MLSPSNAISFPMAALFIADLTGTPVSVSFLMVLLILVVELCLASPGFVVGCSIIFPSLGMSADYVGIISAYGVFTRNVAAAFNASYRMLEQIEAAKTMNKLGINR